MLAAAGAKDMKEYAERGRLQLRCRLLPRLVTVIDEFASLVRALPDLVTRAGPGTRAHPVRHVPGSFRPGSPGAPPHADGSGAHALTGDGRAISGAARTASRCSRRSPPGLR